MASKRERKELLGQLLTDVQLEYQNRHHKLVSQNDFAASVIGVSPQSFSQWITKTRLPTGDNIYALGEGLSNINEKWRLKFYEIMDLPQPMPQDAWLQAMVKLLAEVPEADRQKVAEVVKNAKNHKGNPIPAPTMT